MIAAALLYLLLAQQAAPCADAASCRGLALDAQQRQDFETFHDLAWAAYRKGRPNDPELMLLVARAQSLSGRPGDALVMLERMGVGVAPPEVAADPDFARVRALPRWEEVRQKLMIGVVGSTLGTLPDAPPAHAPKAAETVAPATSPAPKVSAPPPTPAEKPAPEPTKPAPKTSVPAAPETTIPAPAPKKAAPETKKPTPEEKPAAVEPKTPAAAAKSTPTEAKPPGAEARPAARSASAPLSFATVLTPSALVHDAVSKRFIIADRKARRIAVIDGTSGQVATLVGAQGDLGEIGGITIDPAQGDLWVVSSSDAGSQLHRIQLISGRVLKSVALSGLKGRSAVALAFIRDVGLVLADDSGRILRVAPSGRGEQLGLLEYVPRALAADARGRLYVTAGGPRVARFTVEQSLRRSDFVELEPDAPADAPFTVSAGRLHFIAPVDGSYEIRSYPVR